MTRIKDLLAGRRASVEVSEEDGVRSLHLGGDAIQSSIRLDRPDELALDYTRAMMAFLLFQPLRASFKVQRGYRDDLDRAPLYP